MRIRKRLALSSLSTADLQLQRSEAPPPSDPPKPPSDHTNKESRWDFPENEERKEHKELGDETLRLGGNNDIRKIVHICDGAQRINLTTLQSSSSSSVQGDHLLLNSVSLQALFFLTYYKLIMLMCVCNKTAGCTCTGKDSCYGENYEVIPLKKRKGSFERTPNEETNLTKMKSKTNKKCNNILQTDLQKAVTEENGKKIKRGGVIMEGSRCSRVNGRGWRCGQPTLVGYSLCEHHLGKGRLRSMASVRRGAAMGWRSGGGEEEEAAVVMVTKKRTKVGVVKARSMSSLLSQI